MNDHEAVPPGRFWTQTPKEWDPSPWWRRWGVPFWGGDEWGRRTVVVGFGFLGYLVWAYRTCWCRDCHDVRGQTYRCFGAQHD